MGKYRDVLDKIYDGATGDYDSDFSNNNKKELKFSSKESWWWRWHDFLFTFNFRKKINVDKVDSGLSKKNFVLFCLCIRKFFIHWQKMKMNNDIENDDTLMKESINKIDESSMFHGHKHAHMEFNSFWTLLLTHTRVEWNDKKEQTPKICFDRFSQCHIM